MKACYFPLLALACAASSSALKILAPQAYRSHIKHTPASFGNPNYGGSITGQLLYFKSDHLGCKPLDDDAYGSRKQHREL